MRSSLNLWQITSSLCSPCRFMAQVKDERLAAEAALRDREAYLRQLYTSFVPLWGKLWEGEPEESGFELEGAPTVMSREEGRGGGEKKTRPREKVADGSISNRNGESDGSVDGQDDDNARGEGQEKSNKTDRSITQQRLTVWWRGADAPYIWKGPQKPTVAAAGCHRSISASGKLTPGARFVPAERALLDGLEPQAVSVGRLSKEYLTLLGLPHASIRDMYEKVSAAVLRYYPPPCWVTKSKVYFFLQCLEGRAETLGLSGS